MYSNLQVAQAFIVVLVCLIAAGLILLAALKLRAKRQRKLTGKVLAKHEDWLTYVLASLDGAGELYPPPAGLSAAERLVIQSRLIGWIDQLKGRPQGKLIRLCEEMGLINRQLKRLQSPFGWVKLDAVHYLGCMRSAQAVPAMLRYLGSMKRGPLMFIVARAVAKCTRKPEELVEMAKLLLVPGKDAYQLIADIIAESEFGYNELVEQFLQSHTTEQVKLGLVLLQKHTDPGMAELLYQLVDTEDKEIRVEAARLFLRGSGMLSDHRIRHLVSHRDWEIRAAAAQAMGTLGMKGSIGLLTESLADPIAQVRYAGAKSLAMLGQEGFSALCKAASGPSTQCEAAVAQSVIREELSQYDPNEQDIRRMGFRIMQRFVYERFFGTIPANTEQTSSSGGQETIAG